ncbi:hypothetical protein [Streptomyces agglomeratus]|uniref:hypothetical protein n=1 Tax=Streptomyces agglomeratus TaxID=285458 RepID=UPI00114D14DC|nr:hypothetical protein [Streptomyces agglomeratus]
MNPIEAIRLIQGIVFFKGILYGTHETTALVYKTPGHSPAPLSEDLERVDTGMYVQAAAVVLFSTLRRSTGQHLRGWNRLTTGSIAPEALVMPLALLLRAGRCGNGLGIEIRSGCHGVPIGCC